MTTSASHRTVCSPVQKRIRTLVVDDSALALRTICSCLEMRSTIEVVGTAGDGRQALEQVEVLRPDLVLMDIQMPEMNGLECTLRLRKSFRGIQVIILTAFDSPEMRSTARASGANGFATKSRLHLDLHAEIRRLFPTS